MTDHDFELRLQRVAPRRRRARRPAVRPGRSSRSRPRAAAGAAPRRSRWRPAGWPVIRLVLVASLLLLVALATLWLVARRTTAALVRGRLPVALPAPLAPGPLPAALSGPWLADKPATLSFGTWPVLTADVPVRGLGRAPPSSSRAPTIDDRAADVRRPDGRPGRRPVHLPRARPAPSRASGDDAPRLRHGRGGDYRLRTSDDGLRLTLDLVDDPCPSRALVYARTWTRSLGLPNSGGTGVVDAFDPLFTVELPPGGYTTDRATDHLTIVQAVPEFQFLAWKDPQGWNDPCDPGKGRYPIEPGADAFVAYFRQLQGFTVDSTSELEVDGHRAVRPRPPRQPRRRLPAAGPMATKAETGTRTWFLRPG